MKPSCGRHVFNTRGCAGCRGAEFSSGAAAERERREKEREARRRAAERKEHAARRRREKLLELRQADAEVPRPSTRDRRMAGAVAAGVAFLVLLSTLPSYSAATDVGSVALVTLAGVCAVRFFIAGVGNILRWNAVDGAIAGILVGCVVNGAGSDVYNIGGFSPLGWAGRAFVVVAAAGVAGTLAYFMRRRPTLRSRD